MNELTSAILNDVFRKDYKQKNISEILGVVIAYGFHEEVDWKSVNEAIKKRWSPSARERILAAAWKIAEDMQS